MHFILIVMSHRVNWSKFKPNPIPYQTNTTQTPCNLFLFSVTNAKKHFSFSNISFLSHIDSKEKKVMHSVNPKPSESVMRLASLAISFNVRLRSSDMPVHMQEHALRYTRSLINVHPSSSHLARALKKEFDRAYGPAWHCVIGTSFGSFVSHTSGGFIYFSIDSFSVLLFKTEVHLVTQPPPPPL